MPIVIAKDEGEDTYATTVMRDGWRPDSLRNSGSPDPDLLRDYAFCNADEVKRVAAEFEAEILWV